MPSGTASSEPVLLRERRCRASGCHKIFYVCKSCDRGQRYCSPHCRDRTRRLQRRLASARYQRTPAGRQGHVDYQRAYRERLRARSAIPPVTDQSSAFSDFGSSCGSDPVRPVPHSHFEPRPRTHTPPPRHLVLPVSRCLVCGRPGYLQKRDPYEPEYPQKQS